MDQYARQQLFGEPDDEDDEDSWCKVCGNAAHRGDSPDAPGTSVVICDECQQDEDYCECLIDPNHPRLQGLYGTGPTPLVMEPDDDELPL